MRLCAEALVAVAVLASVWTVMVPGMMTEWVLGDIVGYGRGLTYCNLCSWSKTRSHSWQAYWPGDWLARSLLV